MKVHDPFDAQVLSATNVLRFLRGDEDTTGEETGGMIARLRIYNDALIAKQVRKLGA